jgi:hypothetical protein
LHKPKCIFPYLVLFHFISAWLPIEVIFVIFQLGHQLKQFHGALQNQFAKSPHRLRSLPMLLISPQSTQGQCHLSKLI